MGTIDRRFRVDAVYVFARSGPFVRVPRPFEAIVFVTPSAQDVSVVSRDGLQRRVPDNDQQPRCASFGEGQGPFGPGFRRHLGREQPPIFPLGQRSMKAQQR